MNWKRVYEDDLTLLCQGIVPTSFNQEYDIAEKDRALTVPEGVDVERLLRVANVKIHKPRVSWGTTITKVNKHVRKISP